MVVALPAAGRAEYPVARRRSTWNSLAGKLDELPGLAPRPAHAEDPNLVFALFDGFRAFARRARDWFDRLLLWLTWVGTIAAGTLLVLRFGGLRAALIVLGAFASFALIGPLGGEHADARADARRGRALARSSGSRSASPPAARDRFDRAITPVLDAMQIVPAFAYLMPVVILFSVGPGRGGGLRR